MLRHGDARTRSAAAVTAPSGVEAVGSPRNNYSMSPSLFPVLPVTNSSTIFLSSEADNILPIKYARYPTHRECPRYKYNVSAIS